MSNSSITCIFPARLSRLPYTKSWPSWLFWVKWWYQWYIKPSKCVNPWIPWFRSFKVFQVTVPSDLQQVIVKYNEHSGVFFIVPYDFRSFFVSRTDEPACRFTMPVARWGLREGWSWRFQDTKKLSHLHLRFETMISYQASHLDRGCYKLLNKIIIDIPHLPIYTPCPMY